MRPIPTWMRSEFSGPPPPPPSKIGVFHASSRNEAPSSPERIVGGRVLGGGEPAGGAAARADRDRWRGAGLLAPRPGPHSLAHAPTRTRIPLCGRSRSHTLTLSRSGSADPGAATAPAAVRRGAALAGLSSAWEPLCLCAYYMAGVGAGGWCGRMRDSGACRPAAETPPGPLARRRGAGGGGAGRGPLALARGQR
jgi:hypothetical protein